MHKISKIFKVIKVFLILLLPFLLVDIASANFVTDALQTFSNKLMEGVIYLIQIFISVLIAFMIGLGTFVILTLSVVVDLFLLMVPSLHIFMGEDKSIMAYMYLALKIQGFIFLFAVLVWVFTGGWRVLVELKDKIVLGNKQNSDFNIFYDIFKKIIIVFIIFNSVFIVIPIKTIVNEISSMSLTYLATSGATEDELEFIQRLPLTTLITTGLGLPITDFKYSDALKSEDGKERKTIFENKENINFSKLMKYVSDKSLFNLNKFWDLYGFLKDSNLNEGEETFLNKVDGLNTSTIASELSGFQKDSSLNALIQFGFFGITYIVLLFAIVKQVFDLIFKLVTRFIKVIFGDYFIMFHIFLLSTDTSQHVGRRNLYSYAGDILVTFFSSIIIGLGIVFLSVIVGAFNITGETFIFSSASGDSLDSGIIFIMFLFLLFLFGILILLNSLIESIGANFEYYISKEGSGGMKDGYSSGGNAFQSASQVFSAGQQIGSMIATGVSVGSGYSMYKAWQKSQNPFKGNKGDSSTSNNSTNIGNTNGDNTDISNLNIKE